MAFGEHGLTDCIQTLNNSSLSILFCDKLCLLISILCSRNILISLQYHCFHIHIYFQILDAELFLMIFFKDFAKYIPRMIFIILKYKFGPDFQFTYIQNVLVTRYLNTNKNNS